MASKKEVLELVVGILTGKVDDEVLAEVTEALKPKAGGGKSNVEDYTVFDEDGIVTHVFCVTHKLWEAVTNAEGEDNFKADAKTKNGLQRNCIEGDKQWREAAKAFKASKDGIMQDLLDGEIDNVAAQGLLADAEDERKHSFVREDGEGTEERPEA